MIMTDEEARVECRRVLILMKDLQGTLDCLERTPLPISILCLSFYDFAPQVKEEFEWSEQWEPEWPGICPANLEGFLEDRCREMEDVGRETEQKAATARAK